MAVDESWRRGADARILRLALPCWCAARSRVLAVQCGFAAELVPAMPAEYCRHMAQCSISPRRHAIARFFLTSVGLAVAGLISAGLAVLLVWLLMKDSAEFGALGLALGGAMLGYPLGVIGGVSVLKRVLKIPGSIPMGVLGSVLGVALALGLASLLNRTGDPSASVTVYFVLVPTLAAAGLRFGSRKPQAPPTQ
jgi:hypothetical protein